ncbi:unnamed protein product [Camellia sinensis]
MEKIINLQNKEDLSHWGTSFQLVMEPQLKKTNYKFDWLSNLPDNIIYDILSLLHMRDISCVCTLSRRLRQLCFSMPCMNISLESSLNLKTFWGVKPIKEQELDSFTRFVERFLHLRNGADLFRLRIVAWIYNATTCRVQELDLDIALKKYILLASLCLELLIIPGSKTELELGYAQVAQCRVQLTAAIVVDQALTNLSLGVFYGMSNLNITSSSPQDMKITFHDEVCDVKISAAKLRTLFVGGRMGHGGGFRTGKSLIIFAPNLQEFKYVGDLVYISCKGEFKSLEIASVIVSDYPLVKAMIDSFIEFFCCLSKARKMELSDRFIKMLCNQDCAPTMSLENLRHLTIHDGPYKDSFRVPLLASFPKSSPNLRYLKMRYNGGHQPT